MNRASSDRLFAEARGLMPGGVSSPVRAFRAGRIAALHRARRGPVSRRRRRHRYLDYVLSWGPLILGHAHPRVVGALEEALPRGRASARPARSSSRSRLIQQASRASSSSVRQLRDRATMRRCASRAFTGRPKIVKFVGCYHGHADLLLVRAGSGVARSGFPTSGVTPARSPTRSPPVQRPGAVGRSSPGTTTSRR